VDFIGLGWIDAMGVGVLVGTLVGFSFMHARMMFLVDALTFEIGGFGWKVVKLPTPRANH
jgi:Na+/citrate or Na+/malate symporter